MNSNWELGFLAREGALGNFSGVLLDKEAQACLDKKGRWDAKKRKCFLPPAARREQRQDEREQRQAEAKAEREKKQAEAKAEREKKQAEAKAEREKKQAEAEAAKKVREARARCQQQGGSWDSAAAACRVDAALKYSQAQCKAQGKFRDPVTGLCVTTEPSKPSKPEKPAKPINQHQCKKQGGVWDRSAKTCQLLGPAPVAADEASCVSAGGTWADGQCRPGAAKLPIETADPTKQQLRKACKTAGGKWNARSQKCVMPGQVGFEPLPDDVVSELPVDWPLQPQTGLIPAKNANQCRRAGGTWNRQQKLCYAPYRGGGAAELPASCPPGSVYDEVTGQCVRSVADCPSGTVLDPMTGQCVRQLAPTPPLPYPSAQAWAEAQAICAAGGGMWYGGAAPAVPMPVTGGSQPSTWSEDVPAGEATSGGAAFMTGLRGLGAVSAEAGVLLQSYCRCASGYPFDLASEKCGTPPAPTPAPSPGPSPVYPPYGGAAGSSYGGPLLTPDVPEDMISKMEAREYGPAGAASSECSPSATFPATYSDEYGSMKVLRVVCPAGGGGAEGEAAGPLPGVYSTGTVEQAEMQDLFGGSPEMAWAGL
jgi:hypothetical protein